VAGNPLRTVWEGWKRLARRIGDVQARVLLTAFYFTVLAPFALVLRWRGDPLAIRPGAPTGWRRREEPAGTPLEQARRQS
jgi:hypothetical protein